MARGGGHEGMGGGGGGRGKGFISVLSSQCSTN